MDPRIANLRQEYARAALDESSVDPDPLVQFRGWFDQALATGVAEPNAMTLSTVDESGRPSGRVVLLKDVDASGLSFFTNHRSEKGRHLAANPAAALTFWWEPLERQVRVEGEVERLGDDVCDLYFASRPRSSRLGAWASSQSRVVADRQELESSFLDAEHRFPGDVPRPDYWGGYRLRPRTVEFWQGRPGRLHDRIRYRLDGNDWKIERLAP